MTTSSSEQQGRGAAGAEQAQNCSPAPKWAAVIGDRLFPMPRRKLTARDMLDQAGIGRDFVLVRDQETRNDLSFAEDAVVDLSEGNVFRAVTLCEPRPVLPCTGAAKLAFVCDDDWEITLTSTQTGHSLKRLLGLPDDAELLRDFESPNDHPVCNEERIAFTEGCVFTSRRVTLMVKVNNNDVRFTKRRVTGLEIKKTAIAQGVSIDVGCVLYRFNPAGGLSPAIRDDEAVTLKPCDAFNCVAPDDNS
jgi:hypothetical protein